MPGGIQSDVPRYHLYGTNLLTTCPGFESTDIADWSFATGWSNDTVDFRSGARSAKFNNTSVTKGTLRRVVHQPTMPLFDGRYLLALRFWAKKSADYDGRFTVSTFLHSASHGAFSTGGVSGPHEIKASDLATDWAQIVAPITPGYSQIHVGEGFELRIVPAVGTGVHLGAFWLDDVEIIRVGLPYQVWEPLRWWGYVWEDDPQTVNIEVDLDVEGLQLALSSYEVVLSIVNAADEAIVYATQTLGSLVDGTQQASFNFNSVPVGTAVHLLNTIREKVGGATAKLSGGATDAVFPKWKFVRERVSVRNGLTCYTDFRTQSIVLDGRKRLPWGLYSYYPSSFGDNVPSTNSVTYIDQLRGPRPRGAPEPDRFFDLCREARANVWHDYVSMTAANRIPGGGNQVIPAIQGLRTRGLYYSQHTREEYSGRQIQSWFLTLSDAAAVVGSGTVTIVNQMGIIIATFSEAQSLQGGRHGIKITSGAANGTRLQVAEKISSSQYILDENAGSVVTTATFSILDDRVVWEEECESLSTAGFFGWYTEDEPSDEETRMALEQYRFFRDHLTKGGISWGVALGNASAVSAVSPIWRYIVDLPCTDPYTGGGAHSDHLHYEAAAGSGPGRNSAIPWVFNESVRLVARGRSHGSVPQLFNFGSAGFPRYKQHVQTIVSALISGCKFFAWWQWGNVGGVLTYLGPTFGNRKTTGVSFDGVGTNFSGNLAALTEDAIFQLGVDQIAAGTHVLGRNVKFARGGGFGGTVFCQVNSWTPDVNADLTLAASSGNPLNFVAGKINMLTGVWSMSFSSPPTAGAIAIEYLKCSTFAWEEFLAVSRRTLRYEDFFTQNRNNTLVSNFSAVSSIKWTALPHPHSPGEVGILVTNILRDTAGAFTATLASAVVGGLVEVAMRGSSMDDQLTIALTSGDTVFTDTLAGGESAFYIVRKSSARVGQPTNGILTDRALLAL